MCEYPILVPPITLAFDEMNKKELDDYYHWYLDQIPGRTAILENTVKCTIGFEDWRVDYTPESLDKLGEWFVGQVETRKRTEEEIKELKKGLSWPASELPISKRELTNKTFSLAVDIGMYLSQVMLKNIPSLKWEHKTKGGKKWIDYGQPVLAGFGKMYFNPSRMIVTLASGFVDKTWKENRLRELYEIWKKYAVV